MDSNDSYLDNPSMFHCSASIGRTRPLSTIDMPDFLQILEDPWTIDVEGTVETLRSRRDGSIQTPDSLKNALTDK